MVVERTTRNSGSAARRVGGRAPRSPWKKGKQQEDPNTPTTHLAFYTKPNEFFFDPDFLDVTSIEFHGDSESAISFGI